LAFSGTPIYQIVHVLYNVLSKKATCLVVGNTSMVLYNW